VHPYFTNEAARAADARYGIATEAWSPIARGRISGDATIGAIAERLGRTTAQVTLRWHLQRGDIVFPKSMHRERMEENFALFDFELTDEDMAVISALDRGESGRTGPNPNTFDLVRR
jgi:2,5-diketo-D-gluconate reductase A